MTKNPTPVSTKPAPDMAVEADRIKFLIENIRESIDCSDADGAKATLHMLEDAIRAALARPQEVAGVTDAEIAEVSKKHWISSEPGGRVHTFAREILALAASRAPVAVGVEPKSWPRDMQTLPADMAKVLHDNAWALYSRTETPSPGAGGSVGAEPASEQGRDIRNAALEEAAKFMEKCNTLLPSTFECADAIRGLKANPSATPLICATPAPSVPLGGGEDKTLHIKVMHCDEEPPFIWWCHGHIGGDVLSDIEEELANRPEDILDKGFGDYEFKVTRDPGQYGEYGMCEIAPYWDFTDISFTKEPT